MSGRLLVAVAMAVAGLHPEPAPAQPADVRVLTLRVVAEEMYRARPGWEAELRRTVKTVSDIYERTFQIRFVIQDVVPWTVGPGIPLHAILARLRREVPVGSADVVVGFAAERCEGLHFGVAQILGRVAMVQTACLETALLGNTTAEAVLSHEMAHLFGAFHPGPAGAGTVMRYGPPDRFDDQSLRIIRMMRARDFTLGVQGVDPALRQAWSAVYAEGHARDEPNPLAAAIGNAGWALATAGREQEGETVLREALALDPSAARVHSMLGFLYSRRGRLPEAVQELETAKRLSFRETGARTELGFVLLRLGQEDEALVELRDVLRIERREPRPYVGVATILARRNRLPEAIGALQSAIAVDPKYGPAYLELAVVLDTAAQPVQAWAAVARAHDLGEDVPTALWQRLGDKAPGAPPLPPTCGDAAGPVIDLERPGPAFREYVTKVRERIHAHGAYPRLAAESGQAGELQIDLRIVRNGRLECAAVRRSSGSDLLDRYTMAGVRLSQPFPPIPAQIAEPAFTLRGTFRYRLRGEADAPPPPAR